MCKMDPCKNDAVSKVHQCPHVQTAPPVIPNKSNDRLAGDPTPKRPLSIDMASLGSKRIDAAYNKTLMPTIHVMTSLGSLKNSLVKEELSRSMTWGVLQKGQ